MVTVPLPLPLAPEVTLSRSITSVTFQSQPGWVTTSMLAVPPDCGKTRGELDETAYVQLAAACAMVRALVPTVMEPSRAAPVLGATPGPVPLPTVIQESLGEGVQTQPLGETTLRFSEPPAG